VLYEASFRQLRGLTLRHDATIHPAATDRPVASLIRRGFAPHEDNGSCFAVLDADDLGLGEHAGNRIFLLLPTYVARSTWDVQEGVIKDFLGQASALRDAEPSLSVVPIIAMQWMGNERPEAERRLRQASSIAIDDFGLKAVCFSLQSRRKLASLNRAIELAAPHAATAMFWTDDDVRLSPGALVKLWQEFELGGCQGAIGASKIGVPQEHWSSRFVASLKTSTKTAVSYPHGCAIMVDFAIVQNGFPAWAHCDDGFVCFELLNPDGMEPLAKLKLCENATCWYPSGAAGLLDNVKRIRRMQMNQALLMAIFPRKKSQYYFREIMFWGILPRYPGARSIQPSLSIRSRILKTFHLAVFCSVASELIIRAILRRPIAEVRWGGTTKMSSVAKSE
jgi:hypothetical protein